MQQNSNVGKYNMYKANTTRLLTKEQPISCHSATESNKNTFETVLFLPEGEGRQGEGGLRTKSFFKKSHDDKPLISIITVVYNGEKYLEETIQSVINQTYDNLEYIIIDGGSTDGTLDIVRKYEDKIDYWVSEKDKGIYDAMNKGIRVINGGWVLFLGADDKLFQPETISKIPFDSFNHKSLIYADVLYDTGLKVVSYFGFSTFLHNTIHHQSAFYSKSVTSNWQYDSSLKLIADYDLNLKLFLMKVDSAYINLTISLCHDDGASRSNVKLAYNETNTIRKKHLKMKSFFYLWLYWIKFKLSLFKQIYIKKSIF